MRRLAAVTLMLCIALGACAQMSPPPAAAASTGPTYVVFFQEWSAAIDDQANNVIRRAAAQAAANPTAPVMVVGFADTTGSAQANVLMSQLRAQRVYDGLVDAGVAPTRIQRSGRGAVPSVGDLQESRRVEIDVGA
jgi:outer membrane protein OmpA-like peptidoglycan-associated protein